MIDLLVTERRAGVDIAACYPELVEHLLYCERCRMEYQLLEDVLQAEATGALDLLPIPCQRPLEFLKTRVPIYDERWSFSIHVPADRLLQIVDGHRGAPVRSSSAKPLSQAHLLHTSLHPHPDGDLLATLVLHRDTDPTLCQLEVKVSSEVPLPVDLSVRLNWQDRQIVKPVPLCGNAYFKGLPWGEISQHGLALSFDVPGVL